MLSKMSLKTYNYINIFTLGLLVLGALGAVPVLMTNVYILGIFAFFIITGCMFELSKPQNKNITRMDSLLTDPDFKNIETTFIRKYVVSEFITDQLWKVGGFITLFSPEIGFTIAVIGMVWNLTSKISLFYKSWKSKK